MGVVRYEERVIEILKERVLPQTLLSTNKAVEMAIEVLENCPPKESLCYGCNDKCDECELMEMAMI